MESKKRRLITYLVRDVILEKVDVYRLWPYSTFYCFNGLDKEYLSKLKLTEDVIGELSE